MAEDLNSLVDSVKGMLGGEGGEQKLADIVNLLSGKSGDSSENSSHLNNLAIDNPLLNPEVMSKITKIYKSMSSNDDKRVILLNALQPFLKAKRAGTLGKAVKILNLTKISSVINEMDFLK